MRWDRKSHLSLVAFSLFFAFADSPAVGSAKHLPSFRATEEANGLLGRRGICPTKTDCSLIDHLKLVRQGRLVGQSCGGFKNWRCAQGLICKRSIGTLGVCVRKEGMGKGGVRYNVVAPFRLMRFGSGPGFAASASGRTVDKVFRGANEQH